MADASLPSAADASSSTERRSRRLVFFSVGSVAALGWGLFFDQLARVGKWIFDTGSSTYPPLADLSYRYRDAHNALVHGHLYGYQHGAFTYPPITAYLFAPFHLIGLTATEAVWTVGNVVLLAVFLALVLWKWFRVPLPAAWIASGAGLAPMTIFALYPFRSLLIWGQLGLILMLAIFVDLFVVPTRYRGVLTGVATAAKLLPGFFIIWFLAKRDIPAAIRLVVSFLVLTLVAVALWPHASAQFWFHILPSNQDILMATNPTKLPTSHGQWWNGVGEVSNQSLRGLLGRPPFIWIGTMPWLPLALIVFIVGAVVTVKLIRQHDELLAFLMMMLVTTLVSPVSWSHYWVFAVLAPFCAYTSWKRDRPTAIACLILTTSMCVAVTNSTLDGVGTAGRQLLNMGPIMDFIIQNAYVLGGLIFFSIVVVQTLRVATVDRRSAPSAENVRIELA